MRYVYVREEVEKAIKVSRTWAEALKVLGKNPFPGAQSELKQKAVTWNIDFSHFPGRKGGWTGGKTFGPRRDIEEYLSNTVKINSHKLKQKLIREGIKENKCELCGISEWRGEVNILELDHLNSNHYDNSLDNLQLVCPNCHMVETRKRRRDQHIS